MNINITEAERLELLKQVDRGIQRGYRDSRRRELLYSLEEKLTKQTTDQSWIS